MSHAIFHFARDSHELTWSSNFSFLFRICCSLCLPMKYQRKLSLIEIRWDMPINSKHIRVLVHWMVKWNTVTTKKTSQNSPKQVEWREFSRKKIEKKKQTTTTWNVHRVQSEIHGANWRNEMEEENYEQTTNSMDWKRKRWKLILSRLVLCLLCMCFMSEASVYDELECFSRMVLGE